MIRKKKVIRKKVKKKKSSDAKGSSTEKKRFFDGLSSHKKNLLELVTSYGFVLDKRVFLKQKDKGEYVERVIVDFLKSELEELRDSISERRKKGEDLFVEGLRALQLQSKQDIALATMEHVDIEKYLSLLGSVKRSLSNEGDKVDNGLDGGGGAEGDSKKGNASVGDDKKGNASG